MKERLVVIVGPTAVGKSDIAVRLAQALGGEIISGDSVQVYRKLDVGSAKIMAAEQQGIPHHMLDILDPSEEFSVAMFQQLSRELVSAINRRDKIPIIVGGTGLYIRSILDPYDFPAADENKQIRAELQKCAEEKGLLYLHSRLAAVDPQSAARLHPNDLKRVVRALEVYHLTGKPFSDFQLNSELLRSGETPYRLSFFGLTAPRELLYARIESRVDEMFRQGLLEEVKALLAQGYGTETPAFQAIGYRHVVQFLKGLLSFQETVRLLKRDTRRFAKRQFTWFNRDHRITWFDVTKLSREQIVGQMVERICSAG